MSKRNPFGPSAGSPDPRVSYPESPIQDERSVYCEVIHKSRARCFSLIRLTTASHTYRTENAANVCIMRTRLRLIVALFASAMAIAAQPTAPRADMSLGQSAFEQGDYEGAFKAWLASAERGHTEAQLNIGFLYRAGAGVAKDAVAAFMWFEKAALQGMPEAQVAVGGSYLQGVGVDKDDSQAAQWLRKAAVQGHPDGQVDLGMLYVQGRGVALDLAAAAQWFTKAAAQDDSNGQLHLGMLHAQGLEGSPDFVEALKWFAIVSRKGDDHAQQARQFGSVIIERMAPDQIAIAQRRAKEWRRARTK